MNGSLTSDGFHFRQLTYRESHYTDARNGSPSHYIGWMRCGCGDLVTKETSLHVRKGELFYIPMGCSYESFWRGEPEVCWDSYGFSYFPTPMGVQYPLQQLPLTPVVLAAIEGLAAHRTKDCYSIGRLYLLLDALLPHMKREDGDARQRAVEAAVEYMQSQNKISVPALARLCRMSESGLYAAFRAVQHATPIETWHRIQAEKAVNLLSTTDLSVEEIVERLEFCSASYFRKVLREVTGMTPREVRRQNRL